MIALLIDDSRAMRRMISNILKELTFEVVEAGHGGEALELLKTVKPQVILCDWNMPEMDGLQFVTAFKADPANADVPVMMITSEAEMSRIGLCIEAGASEYLMKPFEREALREKLQLLGVIDS